MCIRDSSIAASTKGNKQRAKSEGALSRYNPFSLKNIKVWERVIIPKLPDASGWRNWRVLILQTLVAASGRPDDQAVVWASAAFKREDEYPIADLWIVPLKWRILSARLAKGLMEILHGDLARRISVLNEATLLNGKTLPGLVILRLINENYYASTRGECMYRLLELQRVELKGNNIEEFQTTWDTVVAGQHRNVPDEVLHELYHKQVKNFHGIALDMQVYNRWDDGDPEKSYQFLVDSVAKYIRRTLMEKNKAALHRGIGPMLQLPWQNYNNSAPPAGRSRPKNPNGKGK